MIQHHPDLIDVVTAFEAIEQTPPPFRAPRIESFERLLEPILAERNQLKRGLDDAYEVIDEERGARGCGPRDLEPADSEFQRATDLWIEWLHRYEAIEEVLLKCDRMPTAPTPIAPVVPVQPSEQMQQLPGFPTSRVNW